VRRAIRSYGRYAATILLFAALAVVVGAYILIHQRLPNPFASTYTIRGEFSSTQGLTPGLGQPANVAGVKVGQISGATLEHGRSIVTMSIDTSKLRRVYANARITLFPNTPLDDMQVDIDPGGPPTAPLPSGSLLPLSHTVVPLQSDDFLDALDGDTREAATALLSSLGIGLGGRGPNLRSFLKAIGPTSTQVHELSAALAARQATLARVVHNLSVLSAAVAQQDGATGQAIDAGDETVSALSSQDAALGQSIAQLPGTLDTAENSLRHLTSFSHQLRPTLTALQPAIRALPGALHSAGTLLRTAGPILGNVARPFTFAAQPTLAALEPTTTTLTSATPDLTSSFQVLNYAMNELNYNAGGTQQSYLFWLAWFVHNTNSVASTGDANSRLVNGLAILSCGTLTSVPLLGALLKPLTSHNPLCTS
jgi:phospholipid/cholesterol/gamma-HCH transport system substrate-binding protein